MAKFFTLSEPFWNLPPSRIIGLTMRVVSRLHRVGRVYHVYKERGTQDMRVPALSSFGLGSPVYLTAPTVKPAMKRSRNRLYMKAMGRLAIRQAAISAPQ